MDTFYLLLLIIGLLFIMFNETITKFIRIIQKVEHNSKLFWLSDDPIYNLNVDNDLLNRTNYIQNIKGFIKDFYYERDSAVVSITGKWGDGKTTVINSILYSLKYDEEFVFIRNFTNIFLKSPLIKYFKNHIHCKSKLGYFLLFIQQLPQSYILEKLLSTLILCLIVTLLCNYKIINYSDFNIQQTIFFEMPLIVITIIFIIGLFLIIPFENLIKLMIMPIKICLRIFQSSFLYIYRVFKVINNKKDFIIIKFNPWYFKDIENLSEQFFNQISLQLGTKGNSREWKRVSVLIKTYFKLISYDKKIDFSNLLPEFLDKKGILEIKNEIDQILKRQSSSIIVVIDDIDRLTPEEINLIFKLIRNVADFKNVLYLISFDEEIVHDSLEKFFSTNFKGKEYVKKIVNANFPLPVISKIQLSRYLESCINQIIKKIGQNNVTYDPSYQERLNSSGLLVLLNNIRDIKRCMNTTYNILCQLKNNVNLSDLIVIATIILEYKTLYNQIYSKKDFFCGSSTLIGKIFEQAKGPEELIKEKEHLIDLLLENEKEEVKEPLKKLLYELFPVLNDINTSKNSNVREARICCPECFDRYFSYILPDNYLSNDEMKAILDLITNEDAFISRLFSLKANNQIEIFIDRCRYYVDDLTEEEIKQIFKTFCQITDKLENKNETRYFDYSLVQKISFKMYLLLSKITNENQRFELIKESFNSSDNIFIMTMFRDFMKQIIDESSDSRENCIFNKVILEEINNILLTKIKNKNTSELIQYLRFDWILSSWKKIDELEDIKDHLKFDDFIDNQENLVELIKFLYQPHSRSTSFDGDNESAPINYTFKGDFIKDLIDEERLKDKVKKLLQSSNYSDQRDFLNKFLDSLKSHRFGGNFPPPT